MGETQTERTSGLELRDYFRILSQRKWTAIFVFLLVVGGALALSYQQKPVYESEAQVLVPPPASGVSTDTGQVIEGKANLETEAAIASSKLVAAPAAVMLDLASDEAAAIADQQVIDKLIHSIKVAPSKAGDILLFRAEAGDPTNAKNIAQAFAQSYLDYRRDQNAATLRVESANLKAQKTDKETELGALPVTDETASDALDWHQQRVGGCKCVYGEQAQSRGTIQKNEVVVVLNGVDRFPQMAVRVRACQSIRFRPQPDCDPTGTRRDRTVFSVTA